MYSFAPSSPISIPNRQSKCCQLMALQPLVFNTSIGYDWTLESYYQNFDFSQAHTLKTLSNAQTILTILLMLQILDQVQNIDVI
jgi:hypothetical protein